MNDDSSSDAPPSEPRSRTPGLIPHLSPASRPGFVGDDVPRSRPATSGLSMVGMTAVIYSGLAAVAIGWGLLFGGRFVWIHPGHLGEGHHWWRHAMPGAAAGLGFGLLMVALSRLFTAYSALGRRLHMEFHEVMRGIRTRDAFWLAFFSALGEEALFRGVLEPALGILLSAALFGVVHLPLRRGLWPWPILAFGMGLAFGFLFAKSGDLGGPILAHFVINFLNLRHIGRVSYPGASAAAP